MEIGEMVSLQYLLTEVAERKEKTEEETCNINKKKYIKSNSHNGRT